ncbi:hypothetical protein SAMN05192561_1221 [Halopenitus malekzadehii]|uniref:Uncharacterized protein n=1 Tax=Halopenitus malekzadehii TaxID=1267564 RepID=A0A1H6K1P9_9EURY|nr:hypothetical protein SAMN05192561_1221 [Halopenitus malekzadehii]
MAKSEPVSTTRCLKPRRTVHEKLGVIYIVFLTEFPERDLCDLRRSPWIDAKMEHMVGFWIDGVQPELLVVTRITVSSRVM